MNSHQLIAVLGILALIILLVALVVKIFRKKTNEKIAMRGVTIFFCVLLFCFILVSSYLFLYMYSVDEGAKKYCQNNDISAKYLVDNALAMNDVFRKFECIVGTLEGLKHREVYLRLCLAEKTENRDLAIQEYRRVLNLESSNFTARANIAYLLFMSGLYDASIYHYQILVNTPPPEINWTYYIHMGRAYMTLFDKDKAIESFQKALEHGAQEDVVSAYLKMVNSKREDCP